jgi:diguanylate cyclase (GGDEF)-like protein
MIANHATGANSDTVKGLCLDLEAVEFPARSSYGYVSVTNDRRSINQLLPPDIANQFVSAATLHLIRDGRKFAILQFYSKAKHRFDTETIRLLEAIAERIGPMLAGSFAFERSRSNALTDPLTDLPNERAFFLVMENQIAESQREGDARPLSVLAIDIDDFDRFNSRFGHAAGDRMLTFVAAAIKDNLREMDLVARSRNDEFLVILPKAAEDIVIEVIGRIQANLSNRLFFAVGNDPIKVGLHAGSATFRIHGETVDQLLSAARVRKLQAKSPAPQNILWFPNEIAS